MYKGVDACLMRAIPGNAGVFLAFEETKKYINKHYGLKHWLRNVHIKIN